VKKIGGFPVKNKKLFERSEFLLFREIIQFLALEREPAFFLFCYLFLSDGRKKKVRKALPPKLCVGENKIRRRTK
jgi:hypothetical protein